MAQVNEEPGSEAREGITLVRGADGALYLVAKDSAPVKLEREEAEPLENILKAAEDQLSRNVEKELQIMGACVHVKLPEVF